MKVKKDPFVIAISNTEHSEYFIGENILPVRIFYPESIENLMNRCIKICKSFCFS